MTWGNMLAKSSALILLLPLLLTRYAPEDIVVWYVFSSIATIVILLDFGFSPTFIRLFSYGHGGAKIKDILSRNITRSYHGQECWETISAIYKGVKYSYTKLALTSLIFCALLGSYFSLDALNKASFYPYSWIYEIQALQKS